MSDTPPYPHIVYVESATAEARLFVPATVDPPDPPDPPDTGFGDACATIDLGGMSLVFRASDGEELDPYVDPQGAFTQRNIRIVHPELPEFTAWYRPDVAGGREEWVFELGIWPSDQANMPAYTCVITCANGDEATIEADKGHYWFCRWRWQSAPRPIRRTYETLAATNAIPHLNVTGLTDDALRTVSDYSPMALCGFPANQGSTGGYPGLGIITGWQAQHLVRNAPEKTIRDQGEAGNSYRVFVRDPDSYTPMDIVNVWPTATMYSAKEGEPYIPKGPSPNGTDQGHLPSIFYVPFLLTGDPYLLEAMQFTCNYQQLSLPSASRVQVCGRYLAWPMRAVAECVAATPDSVPSWLLPKSYWEHWLDVMRGYVEDRAANNSDPFHYVFHTIPDGGQTSDLDPSRSGDHVWQQAMLDLTAAWIASWRDEWVEPAEWLIHSCIARASATSGWVRARPSPYHMRLQNASVLNAPMSKTDDLIVLQYPQLGFKPGVQVTIDKEVMTLASQCDDAGITWEVTRTAPADHAVKKAVYGPKCTSWKEAADLNVDTYEDWDDVGDNDHLSPETSDLTYPSYQRAALAQAITAGLEVPELQDAYHWLDGEARRLVAEENMSVGDNWAVVPVTTRRRRHRRSDRTDPQLHPRLQQILDEIRGED